ncbi:TetR/AcrR family transcriptional regulator [Pseudohalocynthiibacter sp. F2068]|jgi:AcrR family transcriptional regulator|uniref:TetR/AcrR family transcriptional regulator n=1 Tax=Pseudohalocynthiibacter sp. F2068 TaxID=2926418 RepID=UPI001FF61BD1|nr:TetR/AcrR family transcriptional regulator [Pseudohalocynthiibacter sp. F2068]MCK0104234.1 TetR/AcrR family transcriptional regulator [Pseudohalocynthiibacter sp. F2068]
MTNSKVTTLLHRDDPGKKPLVGNIKVTRQDWLNVAMDILVSDGVEQVKVLTLGERLGVSRSSFYWYFKSRQDLLDALLDHWQQTNTAAMINQAESPAETITGAVCNVFKCFVNPKLFDPQLDFAIREWSRRSGKVRRLLDQSDQRRLAVLSEMYARYGYETKEATTRARILYYMQIGYYAADLQETMEERSDRIAEYLLGFTGRVPLQSEIEGAVAYAMAASKGELS